MVCLLQCLHAVVVVAVFFRGVGMGGRVLVSCLCLRQNAKKCIVHFIVLAHSVTLRGQSSRSNMDASNHLTPGIDARAKLLNHHHQHRAVRKTAISFSLALSLSRLSVALFSPSLSPLFSLSVCPSLILSLSLIIFVCGVVFICVCSNSKDCLLDRSKRT